LERLKTNPADTAARADFELSRRDLGYGLLLKRYVADPRVADKAMIQKAAWDTVPNVPVMFWVFRIMAGIGFLQIAILAAAFVLVTLRRYDAKWLLWTALAIMPLPWIGVECGWLLAELGRQPWAVEGVLPTFLGASSLTVGQLWTTIIGFTLLYGALAVVEVGLIVRTIRRGPYAHHDEPDAGEAAAIGLAPAE
jgi:cytochrome d ubiquinol oxidase subunit I